MAEKAYDRVAWRGVTLTARHRDALRAAERQFQKKYPGIKFDPAQGSWSGATASAGTHGGTGAVDLRTRHLTEPQRKHQVRCLKDYAGQACWFRPDNWDGKKGGQHIHSLDIGGQTGMDAGAKAQIVSFDKHRNGLKNNAADPTYHPKPKVQWSFKKKAVVPR